MKLVKVTTVITTVRIRKRYHDGMTTVPVVTSDNLPWLRKRLVEMTEADAIQLRRLFPWIPGFTQPADSLPWKVRKQEQQPEADQVVLFRSSAGWLPSAVQAVVDSLPWRVKRRQEEEQQLDQQVRRWNPVTGPGPNQLTWLRRGSLPEPIPSEEKGQSRQPWLGIQLGVQIPWLVRRHVPQEILTDPIESRRNVIGASATPTESMPWLKRRLIEPEQTETSERRNIIGSLFGRLVILPNPGDVRAGVSYDAQHLPDTGSVRAGVAYG